MIVTVNKPEKPRTDWSDIKSGEVFSWGTQGSWYIKVSDRTYTGVGQHTGIIPVGDLTHCSTLAVASKVEITP